MRRAGLFLCALLPCAGLSAGGFKRSSGGTSAAGFLRLPAGGRAAALGRAYGSLAEGADAFFWNPAGLSGAPRSLFVSHAAYLDGASADFFSSAVPLGKSKSTLSAGAEYVSAGKVDRLDSNGNPEGSYTPNDLSAGLSLARPAGPLHVGVTAKLVRSSLLDAAQTFAADAGAQMRGLAGGRGTLDASVANLGGRLRYDAVSEDLPLVFRTGGALRVGRGLTLAAEASFPRDNAPSLSLGAESPVSLTDSFFMVWRAGYDSRAVADLQGFSGYSFGVGFMEGKSFGFDYAFLPFGNAGSVQTVSATFRF